MTVSSVVRQRAVTCLRPLSGLAKRDLTPSVLTQQPDKLAGSELRNDYTMLLGFFLFFFCSPTRRMEGFLNPLVFV